MRFGPLPLDEAEGALNVHAIRLPSVELRKGAPIGPDALDGLRQAGLGAIIAAQMEPGDVPEDTAAARLARAAAGPATVVDAAFTGRANLRAAAAGVLVVDKASVDAFNAIDEAVTLATLPNFRPVRKGEMIATVKIIPFAVAGAAVEAAASVAAEGLVRVAPYRLRRAAVISTLLPGLPDKVVAKTFRVTAARLAGAGVAIVAEERVPHAAEAVAEAVRGSIGRGAEIVLVFGASAIADRRDVVPAGLVAAGGAIEHLGMPVDPGNLLMVGRLGEVPVLGAPGCARSPKENGFDWVLHRLLAGLAVKRADIVGMGVGGLLMDIATRPQPREELGGRQGRTAAIVLAAGRGTRMEGRNKLAAELDGTALVRRVVEAALGSCARPVVVVTGHEPERIAQALSGLEVSFAHNPDFTEGISTSIRTGIAALPPDVEAAAILLADMPRVDAALIDRLAGALAPEEGRLIAVPVRGGRRGNPVVWSRRFFPELMALAGDVGARHLIGANAEAVAEVEAGDEAPFVDIDTREALEAEALHIIAENADVDARPALDGMRAEDA
ncbi:molybdopterin-binding/glycosyltransferase family 2 protein [Bosea sp. 117]|uniref:NTP transferase domain-containing protein n=1 Tax=Bosea sp. 117 TaxID=1125973 RepID=UPI0009E083E7|nr:molybdopterin-binding/glycosyltransferase family 2 protein [Bosea sp. 117]